MELQITPCHAEGPIGVSPGVPLQQPPMHAGLWDTYPCIPSPGCPVLPRAACTSATSKYNLRLLGAASTACTRQRLLWAWVLRSPRHILTLQPSTMAGLTLPGHPWVPRAGPAPQHGLSSAAGRSEESRRLSLQRAAFKLRALLGTVRNARG